MEKLQKASGLMEDMQRLNTKERLKKAYDLQDFQNQIRYRYLIDYNNRLPFEDKCELSFEDRYEALREVIEITSELELKKMYKIQDFQNKMIELFLSAKISLEDIHKASTEVIEIEKKYTEEKEVMN